MWRRGGPGNGQHTAHTTSAEEALIDPAAGAQETAGSVNHAEALGAKCKSYGLNRQMATVNGCEDFSISAG